MDNGFGALGAVGVLGCGCRRFQVIWGSVRFFLSRILDGVHSGVLSCRETVLGRGGFQEFEVRSLWPTGRLVQVWLVGSISIQDLI